MKFKEQHSFEERCEESKRVRDKYPDRYPIICEKTDTAQMNEVDKKKYLVPGDLSVAQFMHVIRGRLKLDPTHAFFIFFGNSISPANSTSLNEGYVKYKDDDGFLYVTYSEENMFGR